jgi:hypothetical protein
MGMLEAGEREPEVVEPMAEVASPAASLAPDGRLDAGPNKAYDVPTITNDLPELPIRQQAVIQTVLSDLPGNAPKHLRASLENYSDELRVRGVQPILGLLKDMAVIIDAAIGAPNARKEWLEEGMCAAFKLFTAGRLRSETRIVERELLARIDGGVRPAARRAVELVDVRTVLVGTEPAGLSGAVRFDIRSSLVKVGGTARRGRPRGRRSDGAAREAVRGLR